MQQAEAARAAEADEWRHLTDTAPNLEEIELHDADRRVIESLSAANPGVIVSSREGKYLNGGPVSGTS
jgi:hypothetical protein